MARPAAAAWQQLHRPAAIPGAADEALLLQVGEVLVNRRERRKRETTADFLETRRVAVLLNELVEVIENLALTFRERLHQASFSRLMSQGRRNLKAPDKGQSKQTKGESQMLPSRPRFNLAGSAWSNLIRNLDG